MDQERGNWSIKGERTMSRGFVAQYAAEAAMATDGVCSLAAGVIASLKEAFGYEHEGNGVRVSFSDDARNAVEMTVYPNVRYGLVIPDVAWHIQENVKRDVERFTGLEVDSVHVHVMGVEMAEEDR